MDMFCDHRQSLLKALLNTFGMHCNAHSIVNRYGSQDTEDIPDTKDPTPLDLASQDYLVLEGDNDIPNEYCEETDTHQTLDDLLEQLQQLKTNLQV